MSPNASSDKPKQVPLVEYGLLVLLATLWGASFSFLKLTVTSIPPLTTIASRTAIAGALLYLIMRWHGLRLPVDQASWRSFATVSIVNTVFPFILIAWGLQWIDASLGVILNSTTPIFAFLITWALTRHEPITGRRLFGVVAGITGIVFIVGAAALGGLGQQLLPQLAIVLASLSYGASAVYGRAFRGMNPLAPACGSLLFGTVMLIPLAIVIDRPWTISPTWTSIGALIVLGVVSTALGNVLYFRLLGTLGSLGTTAQSYLRVPLGVIVGILLLGEELTSTAGLGLVCVVAGVMAMTWPPDKALPLPWAQIERARDVLGRWQARLPPLTTEYILLLVVATLWAGSYIWTKIGLGSIPPLTLMAGRIVIAGLCLGAVLQFRGLTLPRDETTWRHYAVQGVLGTVLPFSLVAWAQQWVDAGPTAILNSVSPVFAFLITWLVTRHEPATALKLFGVVAGLSGVAAVMGPGSIAGLGVEVLPQLAIVVSSLFYAMAAINSRHLKDADPVVSATGSLITAAAVIVPVALVVEQPWTAQPTAIAILAMLALGTLSTGLGFILYFRLVRGLGSIGMTAQSYLRAPIGVLLAAVLLGEGVSLAMLGGMALVVIGVAAMTMSRRAT